MKDWRGLHFGYGGQTNLEIARDRNANEGTTLAEEMLPGRSDPPQLLYRRIVQSRRIRDKSESCRFVRRISTEKCACVWEPNTSS